MLTQICRQLKSRMRVPQSAPMSAQRLENPEFSELLIKLYARQEAGCTTTLRQLPAIAGSSQPTALRLISNLRDCGMVTITSVLHDEFESQIWLTEDALQDINQRQN